MPRPKPPFPAQSGLWGHPTVINNVETLAGIPKIIREGAATFRQIGTKNSPGTKTFALTGHVANTGLIEVPFGSTLRQIIFDIGGGVIDSEGNLIEDGFKAVQIGGPSGGCLTSEHLDLPLDFDSLQKVGAMIGSGGLVVMNQNTCMVSVAKFFMEFTQNESCGKCVLCREGTKQMHALLEDITEGRADESTIPFWNNWQSRSKRDHFAVSAKRPRTRSLRPCNTFAPRSRPTFFKNNARLANVRRWLSRRSSQKNAKGARCAKRNARSARFPASEKSPTRSMSTNASAVAHVRPPVNSTRSVVSASPCRTYCSVRGVVFSRVKRRLLRLHLSRT
jgi:NADH-ubiquinone oxidoreductase-F iron-sulfur binding region